MAPFPRLRRPILGLLRLPDADKRGTRGGAGLAPDVYERPRLAWLVADPAEGSTQRRADHALSALGRSIRPLGSDEQRALDCAVSGRKPRLVTQPIRPNTTGEVLPIAERQGPNALDDRRPDEESLARAVLDDNPLLLWTPVGQSGGSGAEWAHARARPSRRLTLVCACRPPPGGLLQEPCGLLRGRHCAIDCLNGPQIRPTGSAGDVDQLTVLVQD